MTCDSKNTEESHIKAMPQTRISFTGTNYIIAT